MSWTLSSNSNSAEVTCSHVLLVPLLLYGRGGLSFGWGFPGHCQVCDERAWFSLRWKEALERIQIQRLHFSDVVPEFQGGKRNSSRSYSELVVGPRRKSMPSDSRVGLCPPHHIASLPSPWKILHSKTRFLTLELYLPKRQKEKHAI